MESRVPEFRRRASNCWDFKRALGDSDFVEGKNIVVERRAAEGRAELAAAHAAELVRLGVDVLVAVGPNPIRAANDATATIPIVMLNAADPVAAGIIRSLARPGGNITGLTDFDDDLYPKRFELLKTAAPRIGRLAFVENTTLLDAAKAGALNKQYEAAARALGLGLMRIALNGTRDFERATTGRRCARPRSQRDRLPAAQGVRRVRHPTTAAHGGGESDRRQRRRLDVLRSDLADSWRKAAIYVAKILNGAKPADLPVERPTKVELVINLKTAKAIGLAIAQSLLLRADEIIE